MGGTEVTPGAFGKKLLRGWGDGWGRRLRGG